MNKTLIASLLALTPSLLLKADRILIETESFSDHGGWKLDTQFIDTMGSPYLLAHGLGRSVKDATTTVNFPEAGTYKVFVRTKDWVARWKAPGTPKDVPNRLSDVNQAEAHVVLFANVPNLKPPFQFSTLVSRR